MYPGEGTDRWDWAWGTPPVSAAYPDSQYTVHIPAGQNPAVTEILTRHYQYEESHLAAGVFMLYGPLSELSYRAIMMTIMNHEMDWEGMRNEAAILDMAWRFWMGIHVFGKPTREEAANALLGFTNNKIPPIGNGNETEVPPVTSG